MPTVRTLPSTATLIAVAVAAACTHPAPNGAAAPTPSTGQPVQTDTVASSPVALRVESHNSSDVVIYAGRGRMHQRLGTVTGSTTRMLAIPVRFSVDPGGFYLVAHRVGGGGGTDLTSQTITVQAGQTVVWTLESELPRSSLTVE